MCPECGHIALATPPIAHCYHCGYHHDGECPIVARVPQCRFCGIEMPTLFHELSGVCDACWDKRVQK